VYIIIQVDHLVRVYLSSRLLVYCSGTHCTEVLTVVAHISVTALSYWDNLSVTNRDTAVTLTDRLISRPPLFEVRNGGGYMFLYCGMSLKGHIGRTELKRLFLYFYTSEHSHAL